jgi:signal peptidase I
MIVFGSSMENTLSPHDYVFLAKQAYHAGEVQRGDIIVFKTNLPDKMGTVLFCLGV